MAIQKVPQRALNSPVLYYFEYLKITGGMTMHILIALAYLAFDLFRQASPLTIIIALVFLGLAFHRPRYYRRHHW